MFYNIIYYDFFFLLINVYLKLIFEYICIVYKFVKNYDFYFLFKCIYWSGLNWIIIVIKEVFCKSVKLSIYSRWILYVYNMVV